MCQNEEVHDAVDDGLVRYEALEPCYPNCLFRDWSSSRASESGSSEATTLRWTSATQSSVSPVSKEGAKILVHDMVARLKLAVNGSRLLHLRLYEYSSTGWACDVESAVPARFRPVSEAFLVEGTQTNLPCMADYSVFGGFFFPADPALRVALAWTRFEGAVSVGDRIDVEHVGLLGIFLLVIAERLRIRLG